ncbi:hypothetical protein HZH66_001655 [Vespula vulgaris]|uniref:Uncharacterized protein n=1 Tax=Vespula vulgaris TaxID=7454 RepID=A0A834NH13_VESVU|nr:hypothetical protein HZH66_001655 [Vespula vulgaris]
MEREKRRPKHFHLQLGVLHCTVDALENIPSKKAARNVVVIVAGYRGKVTKLKARKAPAIWRKSGKEISTSIREQMEKGFKGRLEKANRSGR